jgi:hypothetical protein
MAVNSRNKRTLGCVSFALYLAGSQKNLAHLARRPAGDGSLRHASDSSRSAASSTQKPPMCPNMFAPTALSSRPAVSGSPVRSRDTDTSGPALLGRTATERASTQSCGKRPGSRPAGGVRGGMIVAIPASQSPNSRYLNSEKAALH